MIDVMEDIESQWHVKLQRKLQERVRRWLGMSQLEEAVATSNAITLDTSKTVRNVALVARETAQRLSWHETHSEVLKYTANSYEKNKRQGFNGEDSRPSKILLMNRLGNGNGGN